MNDRPAHVERHVAPRTPGGLQQVALGVLGFLGSVHPYALAISSLVGGGPRTFLRTDLLWSGALAAYLVVSLAHQRLDANLLGVGLAWLVHRGARRIVRTEPGRRALGRGFAAGTLVLVIYAALEVWVWGQPRADAFPWFGHPNLLAHALLVLGIGTVAATSSGRLKWLVLTAATTGLAMTGSRSAFVGLAITLALSALIGRRVRASLGLAAVAIGAITFSTMLVSDAPWAQRIGGPLADAFDDSASVNLLMASERLDQPNAWAPSGVDVRSVERDDGPGPIVQRVERTVAADWARPQQLVTLHPDQSYVMSGQFRFVGAQEPGFIGWAADAAGPVEIRVAITRDAAIVRVSMGFQDVRVHTAELGDGWRELEVAFTLDRDHPIDLAVGPSPDLASAAAGAVTEVRALQLEAGERASTYRPTTRVRAGSGEALARIAIWSTALRGILETPLIGWGATEFADYYVATSPDPVPRDRPSHAHNQFLSTAFEGGLIGLVGLLLLIAALSASGRTWSTAVLSGIIGANLFDSTLFVGIILLPLAFLCGLPDAQERPPGPGSERRTVGP